MKKLLYLLGVLAVLAGMGLILSRNKAKSDEKAKVPPAKPLAVTVASISRQSLSSDMAQVGTIVADREVVVSSETQGRVLGVGPRVGDHVRAGALLARVDDELKRAALTTAQVNYDKAKQDFDRYQFMKDQNDGGIADIQVENARQTLKTTEASLVIARRQYRDTRITAPISGIVIARPIEIGTSVMPGVAVATIVDVSRLKVKVNISEQGVFKLKRGDLVDITTDVYPGATIHGTITMIGAKADEAHTYPVEVTVVNSADHPLKAGMFGRVSFSSLPSRNVLTVPREAIIGSVKKPQVFVITGTTAHLRNIVVGGEAGTKIEIVGGLSEGEKVVVGGQNTLRDGVEVNVVNK